MSSFKRLSARGNKKPAVRKLRAGKGKIQVADSDGSTHDRCALFKVLREEVIKNDAILAAF